MEIMDIKKSEKNILKKLQSRLKLVIVGDGCVGKTSLLHAYGANTFIENQFQPTVFENYVTTVNIDKKEVEMSLWDTAGQEDLDRLRPLSYSDTDVILLCFSVSDTTSFLNVANKWVPEIRHYCPHVPVILVATKKDLREFGGTRKFLETFGQGALQMDEGKTMSTRIRADAYLECSSKSFEGVQSVFQTAAQLGMRVCITRKTHLPVAFNNRKRKSIVKTIFKSPNSQSKLITIDNFGRSSHTAVINV